MLKKVKINIHFKRINIFLFEALLPRVSTFLLLPILLRYIETMIWAEIVLMIAISEILSKIYLFGFQDSIYRFGNEITGEDKAVIFKLLTKRILFLSIMIGVFFEIFNPIFWSNIFSFEYGLPMRSVIIISAFSSINLFLTQYIKSLRLSRKLFYGSMIYSSSNLVFQFSSIFYIYSKFGRDDRMIVTAYLVSLAFAAILRSTYYLSFLELKIFSKSNNRLIDNKKFLNYAKPAALIGFLAIVATHGSKLILQNSIPLTTLGKYFSYLSYVGILFLLFSACQEYLLPKLFYTKTEDSENLRILIMYLWTIFGYIYFLIFDKLSYVFIPNEFKLNKKTVFLIFLSQILSISRTLPGLFFDIKNILEKKLSIFLISTLMYIVLIFYINDLDEFLYIFISYFLLMATLYLLMSREIYFLFNFLLLQILNLIFFVYILDYLFKFQNIFLLTLVGFSIFLSMKILRTYDSLPNVNSP